MHINVVTSVGLFDDAVGKRMSITYSEIDSLTGEIVSDNKRIDRVITDDAVIVHVEALKKYAKELIPVGE